MKVKLAVLPPTCRRGPCARTPRRRPARWKSRPFGSSRLYQPRLDTDDGRTVEIIQPGFWNHGGGPDFSRAVVRFTKDGKTDDEVTIGNVEVHLRPGDWNAHGHHADAAYDETVLHVVWPRRKRRAQRPSIRQLPPFPACHRSFSAHNSSPRGRSCSRYARHYCSVPCPARCRAAVPRSWRNCPRNSSSTFSARPGYSVCAKKRGAGSGVNG